MAPNANGCEYVIRRAGYNRDGSTTLLSGAGDVTELCGKPGHPVPHPYFVTRPGTTAVYEKVEGIAIRCPEHEDA